MKNQIDRRAINERARSATSKVLRNPANSKRAKVAAGKSISQRS